VVVVGGCVLLTLLLYRESLHTSRESLFTESEALNTDKGSERNANCKGFLAIQDAFNLNATFNGCSDIWGFLWFALPCPKDVLDIGANKGYTATSWLSLWLPHLAVQPSSWQTANHSNITFPSTAMDCGNCGDCNFDPRQQKNLSWLKLEYGDDFAKIKPGGCTEEVARKQLIIHSFDGQRMLRTMQQERIAFVFPQVRKHWQYDTLAFSNATGMADFVQGWGWEHSRLMGPVTSSATAVQVETVDRWVNMNNIQSAVDIIKIDTEGSDELVLQGAANTLRKATAVVFENPPMLGRTVDTLDKLGMDCYLIGNMVRLPARETDGISFVKLTGCLPIDTVHPFGWSNTVCVNRNKPVHASLELLSNRYP